MKLMQTETLFTCAMIAILALADSAAADELRSVNIADIETASNELSFVSDQTSSDWLTQSDSENGPCRCGNTCTCCQYEASPRFRLTEFNIYPTFSYVGDQSATYTEFEFASHTEFGCLEMENRTILNVADLPSTISLGPTNPGDPTIPGQRASGFGDILSGFFFSPIGSHEKKTHLGIGPVITFPTASDDILGSNQFTAGPGIHFSTEINRLTAGFFLWQSWGFGQDPGKKKIDQLFGKPFFIYALSEEWNLIYIPLGMSHSWGKPSGDDWTVPIGGGLRRLFEWHGQKMGMQFQAFDYVATKPNDPEWELRATIEFLFD